MGLGFRFGFPILSGLMFVLVATMIGITLVRNIREWNKNNHSPRLTVPATVVTKRTHHRHHHATNHMHSHTSTHYYVTFQVESGDRMELSVTGAEYGLLAEGDIGQLRFQGTRYLGFVRN